MSVIEKKRTKDKLVLEIDNGDFTKMEEVINRWNFKDIQSFWRFSVSILLETEEKKLWIQENGQPIPIAPAKHSIKA